ncbi:hypothetical protein FZC74_02530 [Sutcliffiella horikoshii]|uniref:Uncharacterized protein n=1 Tax=Sutcliffiella horikoshii TaxID=79883 RepID=A0AA94WQZ5_9BACI|nr:hypothetical protein [Sutcliffiella horikoshii]TYS61169.1 hypothetical protein FZC74_02530 [Sutcliffiella horikoshii]
MNKKRIIFIIVCTLTLLTACQEQKETNEANETGPLDGLFAGSELSYEEYKFIMEFIVDRTKEMEIEDKKLEKWVIRAIGDERLMNKRDLTKEEALEKAAYNLKYYETFMSVAENKYNVTVTEEELDNWIAEGPDQSDVPQHKAYAEALGLTLEELNHDYDRDLYEQTMVMEKLQPLLHEEYDTSDVDEVRDRFNKEVEEQMK